MISVNFEYYRANSVTEAVELFGELQAKGKEPLFYNGGTEIITLMRIDAHYTNARAIIDIKSIAECAFVGFQGDQLVIGSSVTLAYLQEMTEFPLLGKVSSRIADHTSREKITIGGNICGQIKYREAILPLLLTDCDVVIANEDGMIELPIQQVFDEQMQLDPGSFVVQIKVRKKYLQLPFTSKKMTRIGRVGYPLLTVSALQTDDEIRFAFSGLCDFPFRSRKVEDALNNVDCSLKDRITDVMELLPAPILDDSDGSAPYREFVLRNVLEETIAELEGR